MHFVVSDAGEKGGRRVGGGEGEGRGIDKTNAFQYHNIPSSLCSCSVLPVFAALCVGRDTRARERARNYEPIADPFLTLLLLHFFATLLYVPITLSVLRWRDYEYQLPNF